MHIVYLKGLLLYISGHIPYMYCIWEIFSSIRGRNLVRSVFGGSSLVFEGNSRKYRAGAYLKSISCAELVPDCDGMVGLDRALIRTMMVMMMVLVMQKE